KPAWPANGSHSMCGLPCVEVLNASARSPPILTRAEIVRGFPIAASVIHNQVLGRCLRRSIAVHAHSPRFCNAFGHDGASWTRIRGGRRFMPTAGGAAR